MGQQAFCQVALLRLHMASVWRKLHFEMAHLCQGSKLQDTPFPFLPFNTFQVYIPSLLTVAMTETGESKLTKTDHSHSFR